MITYFSRNGAQHKATKIAKWKLLGHGTSSKQMDKQQLKRNIREV